jgi:hypothetical protein
MTVEEPALSESKGVLKRNAAYGLFMKPLLLGLLILLMSAAVSFSAGGSVSGAESFTILSSGIKWLPRAERIAAPRLNSEYGYERGVSSPHLAAIKIEQVPYIYNCFRVREDKAGDVLRLARIRADRFSSNGRITPLDQWEWIPPDRFRIAPVRDVWPVTGAVAGINGKLLIAYKRTGGRPGALILFDPLKTRIVWQKDLPDIPGYAGPKGQVLPGLARITTAAPNTDGDYFDTNLGRVVMTYQCRPAEASCKTTGGVRDGFFMQAVVLQDNNAVRFGPQIRLFADEVPAKIGGPRQVRQMGYRFWYKQNMTVSNLGNDSLIFAVNYNMLSEHEKRPADRDYPCCASFFEVPFISGILAHAQRKGFLDLAPLMPKEKTWQQDIKAESPWDQGAIWSQSVYIDPFHNNAVFTVYEAWGADYTQPHKTRAAFYPGSFRKWVLTGRPGSGQSCNSFCRERRYNGGACFSASALSPGSGLNGAEIPHDQSLDAFVREKSANIPGALYVCSDLGTRKESPDFKYVTGRAAGDGEETTVATFSDRICRGSGALGYVRAELLSPQTENYGYTLGPELKVRSGQVLSLTCSMEHNSRMFSLVRISDRNTSCDMACDSLGAGIGFGYRPYHAEVVSLGRDGKGTLLDKAGVDPDFVLSMQEGLDIPDGYAKNNIAGENITCICGPGRNLRATMATRQGQMIR